MASPDTWNIGKMMIAEEEKAIRFREDTCWCPEHSKNAKGSVKGRAQGMQRDVTGDETWKVDWAQLLDEFQSQTREFELIRSAFETCRKTRGKVARFIYVLRRLL